MLACPKLLTNLHCSLTDTRNFFSLSNVYTIFFWLGIVIFGFRERRLDWYRRGKGPRVNVFLNRFTYVTISTHFLVPGQELSLEINSTPHYYYLNFFLPICTSVYFVFIAYQLFKNDTHKIQCCFLKIVVSLNVQSHK